MDPETSNIFHSTCACFLVNLDVPKGLPEAVYLDSPRGSWTQLLDFEGIPNRCRKCHLTGNIVACCGAGKSNARRSPSWWTGASSEHYTVKQSLVAPAVSEVEASVLSEPVVAEAALANHPVDSVAVGSHLSEPVVKELALVSPPASDDPPRGQMPFVSLRVFAEASASPSFHGSLSSEAWVAEAAKLEDGWIAVKGKKAKPSVPPLDMTLRLRKGNFKSNG